eukprot:GEMP01027060.1.p1 GENE.GEMP01027060.1~~GEMP01027060.1.p1  ORF type:complete len:501 (+),score=76.30 GEMP01027060.1:77-1579(+)
MVSITRRDLLPYSTLEYSRPEKLHIFIKDVGHSQSAQSDQRQGAEVSKVSSGGGKSWRSDAKVPRPNAATKNMSAEACTQREAFSLLNKLTRENFHSVSEKFSALEVTSPKLITQLSDMIFNKAVIEHGYSEIYADLCLLLHQSYPSFPNPQQGGTPVSFAATLLNKCQKEFKDIPPTLQEKDLRSRVSQSSSSTGGTVASHEELENVVVRTKKRLTGLMKFIAHLYLRELLSNKIIREVGLHLVFHHTLPEEHYVECFCILLKNIGATFDSTPVGKDYMNTFNLRLTELCDSGHYSSRIKFFINDLWELRGNKWIDTRAMAQVQTKESIRAHKEAEESGEQNNPFVEKIAGQRPAYIQEQMAKVAAASKFDIKKVHQLVDYFGEDHDDVNLVSDWVGLEYDEKDYEKATLALIKLGYDHPKKADNIIKLIKVLRDHITAKILDQAIDQAKPDLEDAAVDNPRAVEFHQNVVDYSESLILDAQFESVTKKNKKKKKKDKR